jgi:ferredoxin-NADP reductase/ferredoxin
MSFHHVRLLTSDGESVAFDCAEDETVVDAARRAEHHLPISCGEGHCGICRGHCRDGEIRLGEHSAAALPPDAARRGDVLLCRSFPLSDVELAVPFTKAAMASVIQIRPAEITGLDAIGGRSLRLRLALLADADGGRVAEFEPGQFMELTIPDGSVTRAYSLTNTPNWTGELEFIIRLQEGGQFSTWLERHAGIGQVLAVRGPLGGFGLRESGLRPRWFACGGTGLAPLLSMLRRMAEWREPHPARLYVGVNGEADLFALDDLDRLQQPLPGLVVELCVWKPGPDWRGYRGTPVAALDRDLSNAATRPDLYLCGPPGFVAAAEAMARAHGLPDDSVIAERFLPS